MLYHSALAIGHPQASIFTKLLHSTYRSGNIISPLSVARSSNVYWMLYKGDQVQVICRHQLCVDSQFIKKPITVLLS